MITELNQFARYEIGYDDLPAECKDDLESDFDEYYGADFGFDYEVAYQMTVDDLMAVVDRLERKRSGEDYISSDQFFNEWVLGLCDMKLSSLQDGAS